MSRHLKGRAISRYGAIALVTAKVESGMDFATAIAEVAKYSIPDSSGHLCRPSKRSLYRWYAQYKNSGPTGLNDKPRTAQTSRALDDRFLDFLAQTKAADPEASIPEVIRRATVQKMHSGKISRTSVWRAAKKLNLPIFADKTKTKKNMRRFAYAHRMQMVLCDGKHFRAGVRRTPRVVLTFLDDASRCVLASVVGSSETTTLFLRGILQTMQRVGRMSILFVDNGSGFVANDSIEICARLGISLVHGTAGYPEGHGKIERFNQTMLHDLLRGFDGNPAVDQALPALELRIHNYCQNVYNRRSHHSLDLLTPAQRSQYADQGFDLSLGRLTPAMRFDQDSMSLSFPQNFATLADNFVVSETRKVSRDGVIKLDGKNYELPSGYSGTTVEVARHALDGKIFFIHEGRRIELHQADLVANAKASRGCTKKQVSMERRPIQSAADIIFSNDYPVMVAADGSFHSLNKEL